MWLKEWSEYRGHLKNIQADNGVIELKFHEGAIVEIPQSSGLERKLSPMIGCKISILRTDLVNKPYLIKRHDDTIRENKEVVNAYDVDG